MLRHVAATQKSKYSGGGSPGGVFQVSGTRTLSNIDIHLINLFCRNVNIAFENIYLKNEAEDTQKEIVFRLGGAVETRSQETGNHLKQVSEYSHMLAISYGLSSEEAEIVHLASTL